MKQAIVINFNESKIDKIRKRYIPKYNKYKSFKPHVTLVYAFEVKDQKKLNEHIKNVVKGIKSFNLSLKGFQRSVKEYYLYLLLDKGKSKVMALYKKLNKGVLSSFKNKDMTRYIPHITLGVFKTRKQIDEASEDLKKKKVGFKTNIKSIQLLTLNKNHSIKKTKRFNLK